MSQQKKYQDQTKTFMTQQAQFADPAVYQGYTEAYGSAYLPLSADETEQELAHDETLALYANYNAESYEVEEEALENDQYLLDKALRQAQRLAEQALLKKYNADVAALQANTTILPADLTVQQTALKTAYDAEVLKLKDSFTS